MTPRLAPCGATAMDAPYHIWYNIILILQQGETGLRLNRMTQQDCCGQTVSERARSMELSSKLQALRKRRGLT